MEMKMVNMRTEMRVLNRKCSMYVVFVMLFFTVAGNVIVLMCVYTYPRRRHVKLLVCLILVETLERSVYALFT